MNIDTIAIIITLLLGFSSFWIGFAQLRSMVKIETRDEFKELKQNQQIIVQFFKELKEDNKLLANKIDKVNSDLSARIDKVNSDLSARIDKVNSDLSARIDANNARLDTVITTIFKKDVA